MARNLNDVLLAAQERGLLPPEAELPEGEHRPWPVLLLIGLGAWLASLPLLGMMGLMFGKLLSLTIGPYVLGIALLVFCVKLLRTRSLPVFVEQLALPVLLSGGGCLAWGLGRDLGLRPASGLLAAVALVLALAIPRPGLRTLLGALAAAGMAVLLGPDELPRADRFDQAWLVLHLLLLAGLAALLWQERTLLHARGARLAQVLEDFAGGWLVASIAGLAVWSGITFLAAGVLGDLGNELAQQLGARRGGGAGRWVMAAVSALLALVGGGVLASAWPRLREPRALLAGAVLVGLAWLMPSLGALWLAAAFLASRQRWFPALAAALAAAWTIGAFYYQLHWPLVQKALVLAAAGALLGLLAWTAHRPARGDRSRASLQWLPVLGIALTAVVALVAVNQAIRQKERLIAQGDKVFVRLALVDPRSLMQGDYMRLAWQLPRPEQPIATLGARRPYVVARRDERGVATLLRIVQDGAPLAPGELRIELTPDAGRWTLVTEAWFFAEGDAERWQRAEYGEFRVEPGGRALLVGLVDEDLRPIGSGP